MGDFTIFGIGFSELFFILILAGIFLGPQRIRVVARKLGQYIAQLQKITRQFRQQLDSELDADDLAEIKGALGDIRDLQKQVADLRGEIYETGRAAITESNQLLEEAEADAQALLNAPDSELDEPNNMIGGDNLNGTDASSSKDKQEETPPVVDQVDVPENKIAPPRPTNLNLPTALDIEDDPE